MLMYVQRKAADSMIGRYLQKNKQLLDVKKILTNSLCIILLLTFFLNIGCTWITEVDKQPDALKYEDSIEIARQYLIETGRYNEDYKIYNDPDNSFWEQYASLSPEMLKDYGLENKDYYAHIFYRKGFTDVGVTVFVDKKKKRPIGLLYNIDTFETIPPK